MHLYLTNPMAFFYILLKPDSSIVLKGWNNNKYNINEQDINLIDTSYLVNYENGFFEIINKQVTFKKKIYMGRNDSYKMGLFYKK